MQEHEYQSPVGWDTHPDDVAPGCLFYEDHVDRGLGKRVYCYGSVGMAADGRPHLKKKGVKGMHAVRPDAWAGQIND